MNLQHTSNILPNKQRAYELLLAGLILFILALLILFAYSLSEFEVTDVYCPVESPCYQPAFSGPLFKTRQGRLIEAFPNSHPKPLESIQDRKIQQLIGN